MPLYESSKIFPDENPLPLPYLQGGSTNHQDQKVARFGDQTADKIIGDEFHSILKWSNILGACPLSFGPSSQCSAKEDENHGRFKFGFRLASRQFVICVLSATLIMSLWVFYILDIGRRGRPLIKWLGLPQTLIHELKDILPPKIQGAFATQAFVDMFYFFIAVPPVVTLIFGWFQSPILIKFLNNWRNFELSISKMSKITSEKEATKREKIVKFPRNFLKTFPLTKNQVIWIQIIFLSLVSAPIYLIFNGHFHSVFSMTYGIFSCISLLTAELVEDAKTVLGFKSCSRAMQQLRREIEKAVQIQTRIGAEEDDTHKNPKLTETDVKNWLDLLLQIRKQLKLWQRCTSPRELCGVAHLVAFIIISLFTELNLGLSLENKTARAFVIVAAIVGSVHAIRILVKIKVAENLAEEEVKLGLVLFQIHAQNSDLTLNLGFQIKIIQDLIGQSPYQVTYGGIVKYNKALLLQMKTMVATYLIVLLQFAQADSFSD